jgi:hypothetical protein
MRMAIAHRNRWPGAGRVIHRLCRSCQQCRWRRYETRHAQKRAPRFVPRTEPRGTPLLSPLPACFALSRAPLPRLLRSLVCSAPSRASLLPLFAPALAPGGHSPRSGHAAPCSGRSSHLPSGRDVPGAEPGRDPHPACHRPGPAHAVKSGCPYCTSRLARRPALPSSLRDGIRATPPDQLRRTSPPAAGAAPGGEDSSHPRRPGPRLTSAPSALPCGLASPPPLRHGVGERRPREEEGRHPLSDAERRNEGHGENISSVVAGGDTAHTAECHTQPPLLQEARSQGGCRMLHQWVPCLGCGPWRFWRNGKWHDQ